MLVNVCLDKHSVAVYVLLVNVCLTFVYYLVKMVMLLLVNRIGLRRGATRAVTRFGEGMRYYLVPFSFPWKTKAVNLRGLGTKPPLILSMLCYAGIDYCLWRASSQGHMRSNFVVCFHPSPC